MSAGGGEVEAGRVLPGGLWPAGGDDPWAGVDADALGAVDGGVAEEEVLPAAEGKYDIGTGTGTSTPIIPTSTLRRNPRGASPEVVNQAVPLPAVRVGVDHRHDLAERADGARQAVVVDLTGTRSGAARLDGHVFLGPVPSGE